MEIRDFVIYKGHLGRISGKYAGLYFVDMISGPYAGFNVGCVNIEELRKA